jgi:hypothetical protein
MTTQLNQIFLDRVSKNLIILCAFITVYNFKVDLVSRIYAVTFRLHFFRSVATHSSVSVRAEATGYCTLIGNM